MFKDFKSANPIEIAAFYQLGQLITGDIELISTNWLEQGYDGENIASLAFGTSFPNAELEGDFEKALSEVGVIRNFSIEESIWLAVRYFLGKIAGNHGDILNHLSCLISLEREWGEIELFDRPDCDAYFEERKKKYTYAGQKFAGQNWGIEKLYSIFYSSDDWSYGCDDSQLSYDEWLISRKEEQKQSAVSEAQTVLEKFYSLESDLPDSLKNLGELIK